VFIILVYFVILISWIVLYGCAGVISVIGLFTPVSPRVTGTMIGVSLAWTFSIISDNKEFMDLAQGIIPFDEFFHYEPAREVAGLGFTVFGMVWLIFIQSVSPRIKPLLSILIIFISGICIFSSIYASSLFHDFSVDAHCGGGQIIHNEPQIL